MMTLRLFLFFAYILANFLALPVHAAALTQTKPSSTTPQLVGADSNNKPIDLQTLRGKTVLLTFYSVGCGICERDIKLMREFYRDNKAKNFLLIGINLESKQVDFDNYAKFVKIATPSDQQFPLLWKQSLKKFEGFGNIKSDPTYVIINDKGEITLRRDGSFKAEDWDFLWESLTP